MTPVAALKLRPGGSAPADKDSASGAVPPDAVTVVLYAVPTTPAGGMPEKVGAGLIVMLTVLLLLVPGIIAVKITLSGVPIEDGAVYVTVSPGEPETVPHVAPEQPLPLATHEGAVDELAVMLTTWPASRVITEVESVAMPVPA